MKITRNKKIEANIYEAVKTWLQRKPRSQDKLHVSDLLYPRKTFWQKIDPRPMTDDQAGYFVAGHAHHGIIEAVLGPRKKDGRSDAGEVEKAGIYFSPDLRMKNGPVEIKTSRAMYEPKDLEDGYSGYLKQLTSYMALMGSMRGALIVFYLTLKDGFKRKPAFRYYKVKLTQREIQDKLVSLKKLARTLTEAIKKKKWQHLETCPLWLCKECVYYKECKPWLRNKAYKNLQNAK